MSSQVPPELRTAVNTSGSVLPHGAPAESEEHSISVGPNGPLVLHDHHLVDSLAHFNRENIPERKPHAKGSGAFGTFTVTGDVSQYIKAAVFQPGVESETLARFSTVAGELGSPDTWRDVRGFSVRWYTEDGNYDVVGNNTPVFFLRDPMKFPHFIRSQKRLPSSGLRDNQMQWDFWSLSPETAHQVVYLMGDRGLPRSYRHMQGYGSHTFMWINAAGEKFWVKYHFLSEQGVEALTDQDATRLAGEDADYHRRDLFDAIARKDYPRWRMHVQVMPYAEAADYHTNPFDLTKVWPHADYPLIEVGTLELNRNPANFFAEIDQAAFTPANLVPGIGLSPDKMLLARAFAYGDAHRARLGKNYDQLPVNAPRNDAETPYTFDGAMTYHHAGTEAVYAPNSAGRSFAEHTGPVDASWESDGELIRSAYTLRSNDDDFSQARALINDVWDEAARSRYVDTVSGHLKGGVTGEVLDRALWYLRSVDEATGEAIEKNVRSGGSSPAAGISPLVEPSTR